MAIYFTRYNTL